MYDSELDFVFSNSTKVIFGIGAASKVAQEVHGLNANHVLLVTDRFLSESKMVQSVKNNLGSTLSSVFSEV